MVEGKPSLVQGGIGFKKPTAGWESAKRTFIQNQGFPDGGDFGIVVEVDSF